jgi:long-chain acyl-CoA synthetase
VSEIIDRFERIRRDRPTRPLIHLPAAGVTLTTDDVWTLAQTCRGLLGSRGLGRDHLVISAAGNRPATLALWLACRALDMAFMPIEASTVATEMRELAGRYGATLLIVPRGTAHQSQLGPSVPFDDDLEAVTPTGIEPKPHIYRGAATLKLTSGSSGIPKATFTRESEIIADGLQIVEAMDIRPDDCQIAVIPLSHSYGLGNLVMPALLQGTAMVLREAFIPPQLIRDASAYEARVWPGVPFMFAHLVTNADAIAWPSCLSTLISAGAPLDTSTVHAFAEAFGIKLHSFYGASESGGITYDDSSDLGAAGSVGHPLPGVEVSLRPADGTPADGGRVHVASAAVSYGYAGLGEDDTLGGGGFLTGDLGRFDAAGNLRLTGRLSSFVNVAGRKVQPEEVEQVLRTMSGIADVRVLGLDDPVRGQQLVACLVADSRPVGAEAVRRFCAARVAAHKIPRAIVWLESIPLTERGKTDRATLESLVRERLGRSAESDVL